MPEKLDYLTLEKKYVRPLCEQDKPDYTEAQKSLIAYSVAWEGYLGIVKHVDYYTPVFSIANTDFELLANFSKILRLGHKRVAEHYARPRSRTAKMLEVNSFHEILFILQQLKGYMPCEKYRKLRSLIAEFCALRIKAHEKGTRAIPYTAREHEIFREVKKLNKRGAR